MPRKNKLIAVVEDARAIEISVFGAHDLRECEAFSVERIEESFEIDRAGIGCPLDGV